MKRYGHTLLPPWSLRPQWPEEEAVIEAELRQQRRRYDDFVTDAGLQTRYAGDWIPYGRVPIELIPELDPLERIGTASE